MSCCVPHSDKMESAGLGHVLEEMLTQLESCTGFSLPDGYDQTLGDMFHLRQPLQLSYRCDALQDIHVIFVVVDDLPFLSLVSCMHKP